MVRVNPGKDKPRWLQRKTRGREGNDRAPVILHDRRDRWVCGCGFVFNFSSQVCQLQDWKVPVDSIGICVLVRSYYYHIFNPQWRDRRRKDHRLVVCFIVMGLGARHSCEHRRESVALRTRLHDARARTEETRAR